MRVLPVAVWFWVVVGAIDPALAQAPDPFQSVVPAKPQQPKPRPAIVPKPPAPKPVVAAEPGASTVVRDCPDCPELVLLPSGRFQMGVPEAESPREGTNDNDARPVHTVTIGYRFYMGKYPVTRGEYGVFARATGRTMRDPGFPQDDRHPVVDVSWEDAQAYVAWLRQRTGKDYRLPTEAEWEYAARAGTRTARYWGETADGQCAYANGADLSAKREYPGWVVAPCDDGYARTSPVGTYRPNGFGLYDMLGNVWQWVQDCYDKTGYGGAPDDGSVASGGDCSFRVLRGGSWDSKPADLRAGHRDWIAPGDRGSGDGFRVSRTLTP